MRTAFAREHRTVRDATRNRKTHQSDDEFGNKSVWSMRQPTFKTHKHTDTHKRASTAKHQLAHSLGSVPVPPRDFICLCSSTHRSYDCNQEQHASTDGVGRGGGGGEIKRAA